MPRDREGPGRADLAQRRFMMVNPGNRLVADTLESDWNEKLRALAKARDERERARAEDRIAVDDAIRARLVAMTTDHTAVVRPVDAEP